MRFLSFRAILLKTFLLKSPVFAGKTIKMKDTGDFMENNSFKSSVFGGFKRQDVINYIEKSAKESRELIDSMEAAKKALQEENDSMQSELTTLREEHSALQSENEALQQEVASLRQAAQELESTKAELARLQQLLAETQPLAEEYSRAKDNIGSFEIEARKRADELELVTKKRLLVLMNDLTAQYQRICTAMESTVQHIGGELRNASTSLSQLPISFNKLSSDLEEVKKSVQDF